MADGLRLDDMRSWTTTAIRSTRIARSGDLDRLSHRIRSEFQEMPGTCLTLAQAIRLFGIPPDVGLCVLRQLVDEGLLQVTVEERYRLRSSAA
jgi:hypothetical protein